MHLQIDANILGSGKKKLRKQSDFTWRYMEIF